MDSIAMELELRMLDSENSIITTPTSSEEPTDLPMVFDLKQILFQADRISSVHQVSLKRKSFSHWISVLP